MFYISDIHTDIYIYIQIFRNNVVNFCAFFCGFHHNTTDWKSYKKNSFFLGHGSGGQKSQGPPLGQGFFFFFFFSVLGLELRAFTLSHSTSPFLQRVF
jgi:hypothetical protein